MTADDKLLICKKTRKIATDALLKTLRKALKRSRISEKQFRDLWLEELRNNPSLFPNGWYVPPPHGLIVLFATVKNPTRVLYPSMRPKVTWPRSDIYLDKTDGVLAFYASPVDRKSGVIGDMEVMVYLGNDKEIINSLKTCVKINKDVFEFLKAGQKISDIAKFANKLINSKGFVNNILSTNDPQIINIGHTIPITYQNWTNREESITDSDTKNWQNVCNLISKKRIFINEAENFEIRFPLALSIEPRLRLKNRTDLPSAWSHSIIFFDTRGNKEQLFGFDQIYKICGMKYLI